MVYTLTLNPSLDYSMHISENFPDIQLADKVSLSYGGKGVNVSVVLTRLKIKNTAFGFSGGLNGQKLKSLLDAQGVNANFTDIDDETRINVKISGAHNICVNAPGPVITLKDEQQLLKKLSLVGAGDYLVLSGSVPPSMGAFAYERLLQNIKSSNFKIIADTTGQSLKSVLKYNPFLIKPNNFELESFVGRRLEERGDILSAARQLQKSGAQNVLVSMGKGGMLLLDETGSVSFESIIDGETVSTNGCGDSAVAGFIAGYIMKNNYSFALKTANACANATAFSADLCSLKDVMKYLGN